MSLFMIASMSEPMQNAMAMFIASFDHFSFSLSSHHSENN